MKASFDECLHLVARAHAQELRQLRDENALLRRRVSGTPSRTPRSEGASIVAVEGQQDSDAAARGSQALRLLGAAADLDASSLPGAVDAGAADCQAWTSSKGTREGEARPSTYSCTSSQIELRFPLMGQWRQQADLPQRRTRTGSDLGGARFPIGRRLSKLLAAADVSSLGSQKSGSELRRLRCISSPSSRGRLLWDMLGAALILYDLIAIPLEAFSPPRTTLVVFMDWLTLVFWTANMPMSLQVGFVLRGVTIMDFDKICANYLRTWFLLDMAVVVPDWVFTLASLSYGNMSSTSDSLKLLRTLRLVRLTRLLRLLKLGRILRSLNDLIETENVSIFANIAKMLVVLLLINHYVGCLWYLIGTSRDGDDTWVVYHQFNTADWAYQYLTSFHWAITQFTPASMHVQPQNLTERAFAILVVVFALVGFSYVVGSISGSLTQLRSMQEETYKQFWLMRRCLKQNRVPLELSGRITRYLEHAWQSQRQTVNPRDYKIFSLLSEQLQSELHCEIWMPCLRAHELFSELSEVSGVTLRRVATSAMQRKPLAQGDHVFHLEQAMYMYILLSGCMQYTKTDSEREEQPIVVKRPEDFVAEPVLWTPNWVHLGVLTATSETEVLALDPQKFADIMRRTPDAFSAALEYGRGYVDMLNDLEEHELSDIIRFEKPAPVVQKWSSRLPVDFAAVWR